LRIKIEYPTRDLHGHTFGCIGHEREHHFEMSCSTVDPLRFGWQAPIRGRCKSYKNPVNPIDDLAAVFRAGKS
jgi:hypothetical protein